MFVFVVCGLVSLLSFDIRRLILLVAVFVVVGFLLLLCVLCAVCCCLVFLFLFVSVARCLLLCVVWCCLMLFSVGCLWCVVVYGFALRVACWLALFFGGYCLSAVDYCSLCTVLCRCCVIVVGVCCCSSCLVRCVSFVGC